MLERILWFVTALVILALAFFFIAAAIVVGMVLGTALIARIWWINRKMRKAAEQQILTAEYTVVERESAVRQRLPNEGGQPLPAEVPSRQPRSGKRRASARISAFLRAKTIGQASYLLNGARRSEPGSGLSVPGKVTRSSFVLLLFSTWRSLSNCCSCRRLSCRARCCSICALARRVPSSSAGDSGRA